nr:MAG TPA: upper collar protein [Caudoviricetes sp.]
MSRNENKTDIQRMKDILRTQLSSYYQNIAVSVFEWEGMPDQVMRIPRRQPEKQLYETGCFTMFRHEDSGQFFMLPVASMNIQKNAYGEPSQWRAMALGELAAPIGALKLSPENAVLFRNNDTYTPSKPYVEELIKQLVNVEYTLRLNINAQKMPWSMRSNNYNIVSNKNLFRQIYECEPIVYHDDMMTDELELIKTDAPVIMAELNDAYNVYDQRICEFLGIDCVARDKKERLTAEEADANDEKIDSIKKVKLEQRKEGCDLANDLWGIDLSVKLADYTKDPSDSEMKEDMGEGGNEDGNTS